MLNEKQAKFTKDLSVFDVREAVDQILCI
jgi:signal transduction histidine kinase